MPIRDDFPPAGSKYMDGRSDGWEYITVFSGSTLQQSYDMLRTFLEQEGFGDVPVPLNADELLLFKFPSGGNQLYLFAEPGYIHNPIKIKFHKHHKKPSTLILHIYNEKVPGHLLKFHGVMQ